MTDTQLQTSRYIKSLFGLAKQIVEDSPQYTDPADALCKEGFRIRHDPFNHYASKDGLRFRYGRYPSVWTYHIDFYVYIDSMPLEDGRSKGFHIHDLDEHIGEITASGYVREYVRPKETEDVIATVKTKAEEYKSLIDGRRGGELGAMLRARGCKVHYDGFSVCNFSSDFLAFSCHNDGHWRVEDYGYTVIHTDGSHSMRFNIAGDGQHLELERDFEAIFGPWKGYGRFFSEAELFRMGRLTFKRFRVRTYGDKTLDTLKYFDDYEQARHFAYDEAKRRAESVTDDRRRFAFTNPKDITDEHNDLLAVYLYYQGGPQAPKYFVFVQGEDD